MGRYMGVSGKGSQYLRSYFGLCGTLFPPSTHPSDQQLYYLSHNIERAIAAGLRDLSNILSLLG